MEYKLTERQLGMLEGLICSTELDETIFKELSKIIEAISLQKIEDKPIIQGKMILEQDGSVKVIGDEKK